jgi:hypothetical protein
MECHKVASALYSCSNKIQIATFLGKYIQRTKQWLILEMAVSNNDTIYFRLLMMQTIPALVLK